MASQPKSDYQKRKEKEKRERERKSKALIKKAGKVGKVRKSGAKRPKRIHKKKATIKKPHRIIEVKDVVSLRGRVSHAQAPLVGMPTTPQDFILSSSVINRYKYWKKDFKLRIWFQSGHVYDYFNVPEKVIYQLGLAPSKGRYFYYQIRTNFKYTRVK